LKHLIAITSCLRDKERGYHQAIRETWGKDSPIEYKFILGRGNVADHADELVFDVPDGYNHVTYKTRAGHKWAAENNYDYVLQGFTDVYFNLPAILRSDFEKYDYTGCFRGRFNSDEDFRHADINRRYAYASGGMGYWTGPRATAVLAASPVELEGDPDPVLLSWAEDLWTGAALGRKGIYGHNDDRYRLEAQWYLDALHNKNIKRDDIFSLHLGRGTGVFNPQWMHDAHTNFALVPDINVHERFKELLLKESSDIWEYVTYFSEVAKGNVLEIGTRRGDSTAAFLVGVEQKGGHVYSVDVKDCCVYPNHRQWTFIQADSVKQNAFVKAQIPAAFDVLFVDGDHSYNAVFSDLNHYGALVVPGGKIIVHDVNPAGITPELKEAGWRAEPGCRKAFDDYAAARPFWKKEFLPGRAGLGVLHVS
jgi:predicted O-methyltransferase YrrM